MKIFVILCNSGVKYLLLQPSREVAQAGSAPGLGPGGRRFESCLPDRTHHWLSNGGLFI